MRFISIDPSLRNTALVWGKADNGKLLFIGYDLSVTAKGTGPVACDGVERARKTIDLIRSKVDIVQPAISFGEYPSGSQSSSAMKSYGVSIAYLAMLPNLYACTPQEVKKQIGSSNKKVGKKEIIDYCTNKYPDFPYPKKSDGSIKLGEAEHICDAIVIAEVCYNKFLNKI